MKRISCVALLLLAFLLWSCEQKYPMHSEGTSPSVATMTQNVAATDATTKLPMYVPGSIKLHPHPATALLGFDGEDCFDMQYRFCYYHLPARLTGMVGKHWDEMGMHWAANNDEMGYVTFVKHFNYLKEDFVAYCAWAMEHVLASEDDFFLEQYEVPIPDIIYTFDNEIINAYYRRENPVAPEPGTYTTYESYAEYQEANP